MLLEGFFKKPARGLVNTSCGIIEAMCSGDEGQALCEGLGAWDQAADGTGERELRGRTDSSLGLENGNSQLFPQPL